MLSYVNTKVNMTPSLISSISQSSWEAKGYVFTHTLLGASPPTWFHYKLPSVPPPWPVVEQWGYDSSRQHICWHLDKPIRMNVISGQNSDEHQTGREQQYQVTCLHPWLIHLGFSTQYSYNKFLFSYFLEGEKGGWLAVVIALLKSDQVGFFRYQAERSLTNIRIVSEVGVDALGTKGWNWLFIKIGEGNLHHPCHPQLGFWECLLQRGIASGYRRLAVSWAFSFMPNTRL